MYDSQERNWATFCHLGGFSGYIIPFGHIFVPLVLWLLKREQYPFVNEHGKEALNFNISLTIYTIIFIILSFVLIGFALLAALFIFQVVVIIKASIKASKGEFYRYPLIFRFIS